MPINQNNDIQHKLRVGKKNISENYSVFRKSALHWLVPELRTSECTMNVTLYFLL